MRECKEEREVALKRSRSGRIEFEGGPADGVGLFHE